MAHYRLLDRMPSAIVTAGGSEKKIYQGNIVYLNNGDNFEIRFFNPLQEKIGIEIILNGQKKNEGYLVLNPGEDVTLDRFLGEKKKMVFDTYTIDQNNPAAVKAAELNGMLEFKFYKEKTYNHVYYNASFQNMGSGGRGGTSDTTRNIYGNTTLTSSVDNLGMFDATLDSMPISESVKSKSMETGRVEKGDESSQNMNVVDVSFESYPFHTIQYQMKPQSTLSTSISYQSQEIRNYCPQCGYRIRKQNWKFCPQCSEKLI